MPVLESVLGAAGDGSQDEIILTGNQVFPLRKSLFPVVPPTLRFFPSTEEHKIVPLPVSVRNQLKWKLTNITPTIVRDLVRRSGFKMTRDENKWVAMWGKHMKSVFYCGMNVYQKVNHFPGSFHLGRKDKLHINISRLRKNSPIALDFVPQTFLLPAESKSFHKAWKKEGNVHRWIAKPPASSRGTGVFIVSRWNQISQKLGDSLVIQKYIHKPLLINGNKFDLRLYALVTCWDPLKVYVYKQGMVRFATMPYSESPDSLGNTFIHLTNYSLNKMSAEYRDEQKWTLDELWSYLKNNQPNVNVADVWNSLEEVIVKTLIAAEAPIMRLSQAYAPSRYSCFELFGFDVLLDSDLKPWLLEVNISPSMKASSENDARIKEPLVRDLLNVIGLRLPSMENAQIDPTDYGLDEGDVVFMSNSFSRKQLTVAEAQKKEVFTCEKLALRDGAILENLLPIDITTLIEYEDELERVAESNFIQLVPSQEYEHLVPSRYMNRLLNAWEGRYGENRSKGRALLQDLCRSRAHLLPSERETEGRRVAAVVDKKRQTQWKNSPVRLNSARKLRTNMRSVISQRRQARVLSRSASSDSFVSQDSSQDGIGPQQDLENNSLLL